MEGGLGGISPELNNIMEGLKEMDAFRKGAKSPIVQSLLDKNVNKLMGMMNQVFRKISLKNNNNSKWQ